MKDGSKRYYWIRLKADFFDLPEIDFLQDQKNGCEYIVLYQKLCLLAANSEGALVRKVGEMVIPYDARKISEVTRFKFDTVVVALELFKKIGLVTRTDYPQEGWKRGAPQGDPGLGVWFIPGISGMIGSETKWAEKKRIQETKKLPQLTSGTCRRVNRETIKLPNGKTQYIDEKKYDGNGALAFDRAGCKCQRCGAEDDLLIHHNNGYSNAPEDLVVLCKSCHSIIHSKEYGGVFGGKPSLPTGGAGGRQEGGQTGGANGGNRGGNFLPPSPPSPPPATPPNAPPAEGGEIGANLPHRDKSIEYRVKTDDDEDARAGAHTHAIHERTSQDRAVENPASPRTTGIMEKIVDAFERGIHAIANDVERDRLMSLIDEYGGEWVYEAIRMAALNRARTVRYIETILAGWGTSGTKEPWKEEKRHERTGDRRGKPDGHLERDAGAARGADGIDWDQYDNTWEPQPPRGAGEAEPPGTAGSGGI